jgi:hypothetical protein
VVRADIEEAMLQRATMPACIVHNMQEMPAAVMTAARAVLRKARSPHDVGAAPRCRVETGIPPLRSFSIAPIRGQGIPA